MSEEDKFDELRREIERLRRELDELRRVERKTYLGVGDFVEDLVNGIMEGIRGEIERSILIAPQGIIIAGEGRGRRTDFEEEKIAGFLEALANENRLRILRLLSRGGRYLKELEKELPISSPTLISHLNVLEERGLVRQEASRGRYLITLRGRLALKAVARMARLVGG